MWTSVYTISMNDETIITSSAVGKRLDSFSESDKVSYLVFNNNKVRLISKIRIGRANDNDIVVDNKLASRYHAIIQKIKDAYYLKDEGSTNGTFLNGKKIPEAKYFKLQAGDKITIGNSNLVIS